LKPKNASAAKVALNLWPAVFSFDDETGKASVILSEGGSEECIDEGYRNLPGRMYPLGIRGSGRAAFLPSFSLVFGSIPTDCKAKSGLSDFQNSFHKFYLIETGGNNHANAII
jgi:hypothetical protein